MFAGIVEEIGVVKGLRRQSGLAKLSVQADKILEDTKIGDSIAVNGVCLTIAGIKNNILDFDVMKETFSATNLRFLKYRDPVNLERSLKVGDRISGHFVTGHIDCLGILRRKIASAGNITIEITIPSKFIKSVIKKDSISADGISLTVVDVKPSCFAVGIIPHTFKTTILSRRRVSDKLNIELDILTKNKE